MRFSHARNVQCWQDSGQNVWDRLEMVIVGERNHPISFILFSFFFFFFFSLFFGRETVDAEGVLDGAR